MNSFSFRKGVRFELNGAPHQIKELTPDGRVLVEALNSGSLTLMERPQLLADYAGGALTLSPIGQGAAEAGRPIYGRPLSSLAPAVKREHERRIQYLQLLLAEGKPVFTDEWLRPRLADIAAQIGDSRPPSPSTIFRWVSRFQSTRCDSRSLVPLFHRRGSHSRFETDRMAVLLEQAVEDAYRASPKATIADIHTRLKMKIDAINRSALQSERIEVPSLRTAYRLVAGLEEYALISARDGKTVADRRCRLVKAGARSSRILERVEIDHTPLDLFLIDEKTGLPLGRPTLTMAMDHFSRMPFGYSLSFGNPSAAAVVAALRHGILPKVVSQGALPDLPISNDWPVYGLPSQLVTDNGLEFHGIDLEALCFDLGVVVIYCPKRQPRFKGTIERYLKTINYYFTHRLPGTSMARFHERGDYDSAKHAVLTMAEFKQLLEKWMLDVYAMTEHRTTKETPMKRWIRGAEEFPPEVPDLNAMRARIGRSASRTLRRTGIDLHGIRYSDDSLAPLLRAYGPGVDLRLTFDPEDLGQIMVWAPDAEEPFAVRALDFEYANGLTLFQHELIKEQVRADGAGLDDKQAVQAAREAIIRSVDTLMESRKLRSRRKSASVRGVSSARPEGAPKFLVAPMPAPAVKNASSKPSAAGGFQALPPLRPMSDLDKRRRHV